MRLGEHSGRLGTRITASETPHLINESILREQMMAGEIRLVDAAPFPRNPNHPRDTNGFQATQPNDAFVLKFVSA